MCGFVVLIDRNTPTDGHDVCSAISHRGPDSCGHAYVRSASIRLDLHFRRLAIVDLDARSDQPFGDEESGITLYNGELYNADELRRELADRGHHFRTSGDTEVVHVLLQQHDWQELLAQADGMYAFVALSPEGAIRYGRDRCGIKPLYEAFSHSGKLLGLSSEIAPLRQAGVVGDVDEVSVAAAAMFLWVPPPATGWRGCRQVAAGSVVSKAAGADDLEIWNLPTLASGGDIRQSVRESLRRQVHADVPVALLLSGGLDSSWLAYELAEMGLRVPLLSARFAQRATQTAEPFEADAPYAARVAHSLGQAATWFDLDDRVLQHIPHMVDAVEQPFGDPAAIALMGLSRAASEHAKVLLSGIGVEEVFLGYERYQAIKALSRLSPLARRHGRAVVREIAARSPRLRERLAKFERLLLADPEDWPWMSESYYDDALWQRLVPSIAMEKVTARHREEIRRARAAGATHLEAAAHSDRRLFLPGLNLQYGDRSSMRASVELRVPFLGDPVLQAAGRYSASDHVGIGNGKRRFRAAASDAGVPDFILKRSKTGFGAPVRSILRANGKQVWAGIRGGAIFDDLLDRETAQSLFEEHVDGRAEHGLRLFSFCALAVWWETHVSGDGSVRGFLSETNL